MIGLLIAGAIGIAAGIGVGIIRAIQRNEVIERYRTRYNDMVDDNIWRAPHTDDRVKIREMPQMTMERFLTLYSTKPENWVIPEGNYFYNDNSFIPYYVKRTKHNYGNEHIVQTVSIIPIFWESWVEMEKFVKWKEEEWKYGQEAGSKKIRDKYMMELAGYLAEDIKEEQKEFQKQLDKAYGEITLTLEPAPSKPVPMAKIIEDIDGDYVMMSDGTIQKVERH